MTRRPTVTALGVALELLLAGGLFGSWTVAFLSARATVSGIPTGTRNLIFFVWSTSDPLWPSVALGAVAAVAMVVRHWIPLPALVVLSTVVVVANWFYPLVMYSQFAAPLMLVITSFWAMWKTRWFGLGAAILLIASALSMARVFTINGRLEDGGLLQSELQSMNMIGTTMTLAAIAVAGAWLVRRFDRQRVELAERNEELRLQREAAKRAAVLDERVRISRELHDVVAHHVTTMTVHAGAARQIAATNPDGAADSLKQIEQSGREAVVELQRLLGFLRSGDTRAGDDTGESRRAPTPSLRHVHRLAESLGAVECDVTVKGDLAAIPQSVDVSAYRIVQEALTNVMKHASADRASVAVHVGPAEVIVRIRDNGAGGTTPNSETGHGLVGMRERAALHGGSIEVGPVSGGGWQVEAQLPYVGSAVPGREVSRPPASPSAATTKAQEVAP